MKKSVFVIAVLCLATTAGFSKEPVQALQLTLKAEKQIYCIDERISSTVKAKNLDSREVPLFNGGCLRTIVVLDGKEYTNKGGMAWGGPNALAPNGEINIAIELQSYGISKEKVFPGKHEISIKLNGAVSNALTLEVLGRSSLKEIVLKAGMPRREAEQRIEAATGVKSRHDLHAMDTSEKVAYKNGAEVLTVHYKPGQPAPMIAGPSEEAISFPPADGEVSAWEFIAPALGQPKVPIKAEYADKVVYTDDSMADQDSLKKDCEARGGDDSTNADRLAINEKAGLVLLFAPRPVNGAPNRADKLLSYAPRGTEVVRCHGIT